MSVQSNDFQKQELTFDINKLKEACDQVLKVKGFDTSRMTELIGYGKSEDVQRDMVAVDTMKKAGVTSEQVPESVLNALTRDYSDLMKHDKMKRK